MSDAVVSIGIEAVGGEQAAKDHAGTIEKIEKQTEGLAAVAKASAAEEKAQLEGAREQYEQLGAAAEKAGATATAAAERRAAAEKKAEEALREVATATQTAFDAVEVGSLAAGEDIEKAALAAEKLGGAIKELAAAGGSVDDLNEHLQELGGEIKDLEAQSNRVGPAFAKAAKQIRDDAPTAGKAVFAASREVDRLRAAIDAAQKEGSPIPPSTIADLKKYEAELAKLQTQLAQLHDKQEDFKRDTKASGAAAGQNVGPITSLTDVLGLGGSKWANYGLAVTAVIGTFQAAYEAGGKLRNILNAIGDALGKGPSAFDAWIKGALRMQIIADKLAGAQHGVAAEAQKLANMLNVLDKNNIAHGDKLEDVTAVYETFTAKVRDNALALGGESQAMLELTERAAGVKLDEFEASLDRAATAVEAAHGNIDALANSPEFPTLRKEILGTADTLDRFGEKFRGALTEAAAQEKFDLLVSRFKAASGALRDELNTTLEKFGVESPAKIRESVKALGELVAAFGPPGKASKEQADIIIAEGNRVLASIAKQPEARKEALNEETKTSVQWVLSYGEAAKQQRSIAAELEHGELQSLAARRGNWGAFVDAVLADGKVMGEALADLAKKGDADFKAFQATLAQRAAPPPARAAGPAAGSGPAQTGQELAALKARIEELNNVGFLTPDQLAEIDAANRQINELESSTRSATEGVVAFGPVISDAAAAALLLFANTRNTAEAMVQQAAAAAKSSATAGELAVKLKEDADGHREITNAIGESTVALGSSLDGHKLVTDAVAREGDELRRSTVALGSSLDGHKLIADAAKDSGAALDSSADAAKRQGEETKDAATKAKEAAEAFKLMTRYSKANAQQIVADSDAVLGALGPVASLAQHLLGLFKSIADFKFGGD